MLSRRVIVWAALAATLGAGRAEAQTVAISTLPPGAINHLQASAIAKVVQEHSGLQMRVITFNSPAAIIAATQTRQAEFAYTSNEEAGSAANGTEDYEGKAMRDLRVAFTVFPFRVGIIVRNNSDIKKVADLKGKRMATEWSGFKQGIPLFNAMLATGGLSLKDANPVPTTDLLRAADDFKAGRSDAFIFAVGGPKVAEIHASVEGGVRFLSLDDTPAARAGMQAVRREYSIVPVQPQPHWPGIVGTTNLMGYYIVLLAHREVPDDLVRKVVQTTHANKPALVAGHPSFGAFTPEGMSVQHERLQYHPGAIRFFKEKGIWKGP
jgi:TRAP transporter TAXI family solute receptor